MQQSTIKIIVFSTVGLSLGFLIGRTDIFTIFCLATGTGLSVIVFVIAKIVSSYTKNSNSATTKYIGLITLAFVVSLVTSFITMTNIIDKKQKFAENLVPKIEQYKKQNSKYPQSLKDLSIDSNEMLAYRTDSTRQIFSIRFIRDGWHFSEYDSKTKQWTSGD